MTKFKVIDTIQRLKVTLSELSHCKKLIDDGVRYDHLEGGHDQFSNTVILNLKKVTDDIKQLEK